MENTVRILLALGVLAFLVESMVEYFQSPFANTDWRTLVLRTIAGVLGIAIAISYHLDVFNALLPEVLSASILGQIMTGLVIGRGASFAHEFAKRIIDGTPGPSLSP